MKMFRILSPVLFLFLLSDCAKLNEVAVIGRNFEDEIQLAQNLVFTFNKELVPESELGSWQSTKYVEFEPAIEGRYKWTGKNELVFSPTTSFLPATEYAAKLSDKLLHATEGKKYGISGEKLAFHTPFLQLQNTESYWTKSKANGSPVAKLKLNFNYPVSTNEVVNKLKINESDDKNISFQSGQSGSTASVPVSLQEVSESKTLTINIEKGVQLPNTKYETADKLTLETTLPDPKTLEVVDIQTGFENNQGYVRVVTTQELSPENLANYYRIEGGNLATPEETVVQYDSAGNPIKTAQTQTAKPRTQKTKAELTENGFIVRGTFNETDTYILTLTKQMRGVLGASLSEDYTKDLYFGKMPAAIEFVNKKAVYLSAKGNRNVAVNIVNVPKVQVKIAKIYENNILQYLRQYRYENYGDEGGGSFQYGDDYDGMFSDEVVRKTIETENLPQVRGVSALNLSLPDPSNNFKGIYVVSLNSNDEYYLNATKLVSLSDIGLIAKNAGDELMIFANSIRTAEAIGGVEVRLVSSNNQTIQTVKTDGTGVAIFKNIKETGFTPAMVTAVQKDDFNYLVLNDTQVETSRFEVEGKRDNATGFEAFIYGDRNIYRPGETVYYNIVVRKANWESVGEVPVKVRFLMPNGKEYKALRAKTNAQGAVEGKIEMDVSAVTGTYTLEVLNANDVLLASQNISIEEFMPDRIKVDVKSDKESYRTGETIKLSATALNLFGPPASGRNYEMDRQLKRKYFTAKGYESYVFDIEDNTNFENELRQGITDDNGLAQEQFIIPATYVDMGVLEGKVYVTVFDETGRPVNRVKRFEVFTQPIFYGIGMPDTYVSTNVPVTIPLVALNQQGKPSTSAGRIEIVKFDYQTVIEKNADGALRYSSKKQTKVVFSRLVNFSNGKAEVSYAPNASGEYEIRLHREGAKSWTAQSFYAYGYGYTSNSSFEVSNEGEVMMEFDKDKYQVGDRAKVLFKTPFAGKLLVTVERNKVLSHYYVETDKKSAELDFKITEEHLPNVYVSATLIRPLDDTNMPLMVAHGYAPVMVEDADNQLPVEVVAVEKSRSKTKQKIRVKTASNAEVTIAVVDEGILQLKNFRTPDPYGFFYQKRALEVSSHDLYPFLFPELSIAASSSVGGDGYDLEKRINPLSNGRVKLVAFWSGIKQTGSGGEAEFDIEIPQFSGDLRIMAVAYKDRAFGSGNKNMKVADPLVVSTALPRFASPNDELVVPVNITNTTKQVANVTATITLSGALQNDGSSTQTITIAPEKEGRTQFAVKAAAAIGNGKVIVTVNGLKEKFTESIELTVRPSTSLLKTATSGTVYAGQTSTVNLGITDFVPSSIKSSLLVSKSPMVQFADKFDHLLGYPYGCLEQTVSKAFPQLYFSEFVKLIQSGKKPYTKAGENDLNPNYNVQTALKKIETLQLANGGLSMWQAGDSEQWWGTAYACHFMMEAQKAGFEVNSVTLGKVIEYLNQKVVAPSVFNQVVYNEDGSITNQNMASREVIYSLYTLALAGKPNRSVMNYYKTNTNLLSTDQLYLLAAAFSQIGDQRSFATLLPKAYGIDRSARESGGSFSSPIRNMALVLNTLIETNPDNLQIPSLARQLSETVKTQRWLSTQEEAFVFLAMGKLAQKAAQSNISATINSAGKAVGNFTGADLVLNKGIGNQTLIAAKGKGSLYYFAQAEGLSTSGNYEEIDNVLQVRKQFFDRNGNPVSANSFKQNQLVVVKITLTSQTGLGVENVVITDMLPAGLEIENPRISEERDMAWIKDQASAEHFDIRDDRINYFTSANAKPKSFYYLVRAVSKGKFRMGPVSADAMYNGEYRSYSGGGVVVVE